MQVKSMDRVIFDSKGSALNLDMPSPGVYYDIPAVDYFRIKALNQSTLKTFKTDREKLLLSQEEESTAYETFGVQYHAFLMQPGEFEKLFEIGTQSRATNADKEAYKAQVERLGDPCYVYRPSELQQMKQMKSFMKNNYPELYDMLSDEHLTEVVIVWVDEESGLTCKCRIDKWIEKWKMLIDFKTSRDPRERKFKRDIYYYGYDYQLAYYKRGAVAAGIDVIDTGIVAQSKEAPYIVKPYQLATHRIITRDMEISKDLLDYASWVAQGRPFPSHMIYCE